MGNNASDDIEDLLASLRQPEDMTVVNAITPYHAVAVSRLSDPRAQSRSGGRAGQLVESRVFNSEQTTKKQFATVHYLR